MGIPDIYFPLKYRGLDFGITIQQFNFTDDLDINITDFEISLDYQISKDHPRQFDDNARLINSMLDDGRHLQAKIYNTIPEQDVDAIMQKCLVAWDIYWADVTSNYGIKFDDDYVV